MAKRHPHTGSPHPLHQLIEPRAVVEFAALPYSLPMLMGAPRGDGHPVLLLPGFGANEMTLFVLKWFLKNRGYEVETWGFGRNVGFQRKHADALVQKIRYMHHQAGRKVSLVGWSLGGLFSLYGAHSAPESVRQVVTLGSPVSVDFRSGSKSPSVVKAIYRLVAHPMGPAAHTMHTRTKKLREQRAPVPMSCLYSISDGVVPPQEATVDGDPSMHENIRVPGSHVGLGFNPMVLWIVADRLALPEGQWRPFEPAGASGALYRALTHQALPV
jgi:pimeloyl-ACP methyl ester carboxylesterase